MGFSAGMYSTLNQQMGAYRKERDLENTEERHLKYKMAKKQAQEQGLDTSAEKVASMLERVSKVITEDKTQPLDQPPSATTREPAAIAILLRAIKNNDLAALWQKISTAPAKTAIQKHIQSTMKNPEVKDSVNKTMAKMEEGSIDEEEAAEDAIDILRKSMPKPAPDSVFGDSFAGLDSSAETAETGTTVEGDHGERRMLKTPEVFVDLLAKKYTKKTLVSRKGAEGTKVQFFKGADLYIVPTERGNKLMQIGSRGTEEKPLSIAQYQALSKNTPVI